MSELTSPRVTTRVCELYLIYLSLMFWRVASIFVLRIFDLFVFDVLVCCFYFCFEYLCYSYVVIESIFFVYCYCLNFFFVNCRVIRFDSCFNLIFDNLICC